MSINTAFAENTGQFGADIPSGGLVQSASHSPTATLSVSFNDAKVFISYSIFQIISLCKPCRVIKFLCFQKSPYLCHRKPKEFNYDTIRSRQIES